MMTHTEERKRIQWRHIREGMELWNQHKRLGIVESVESDAAGVKAVTLDNDRRLTRDGWMSRKLWKTE